MGLDGSMVSRVPLCRREDLQVPHLSKVCQVVSQGEWGFDLDPLYRSAFDVRHLTLSHNQVLYET